MKPKQKKVVDVPIRGSHQEIGLEVALLVSMLGGLSARETLVTEGPNAPFAVSCSDGMLFCMSKTESGEDGVPTMVFAKYPEAKMDQLPGLRQLWEVTNVPATVADVMVKINEVAKPI